MKILWLIIYYFSLKGEKFERNFEKLNNLLLMFKGFCYGTFARQNHENLLDFFGSIEVKYYLYTKHNSQEPQELFVNNEESVKNSYFNHTLPTK